MNGIDIDEQILKILSKKTYVEEKGLYTEIEKETSGIDWLKFENRLNTMISNGSISRIELYDIQRNSRNFVTLSKNKFEVFNELIAKGYRTSRPYL